MNESAKSAAELITPAGTKYFYMIASYSIAICTLYLWGYWSTFDINILQYADLATVLKVAAIPLLIGFSGFITGALLTAVYQDEPDEHEREAARNSWFGKNLRKHLRLILVIWITGTAMYALFGSNGKWDLLPALIAIPIASYLNFQGVALSLIPNDAVRTWALFFAVFAVPTSYATGLRAAESIESGNQYSYVLSRVDGIDVDANIGPEKRLRFLGQVTDVVFYYNPVEKAVSIAKFNDQKPLTLKKFSRPKQSITHAFSVLWNSVIG